MHVFRGMLAVSRMLVHVRVRMLHAVVRVRVNVEVAPSPAEQQPHRQYHDDQADRRLRTALDHIGEIPPEENHRQTKDEQGEPVSQSPGEAEPGGPAGTVALAAEEEGGNGGEMVGIRGVPQPEQQGDHEGHHPAPAESSDPVIQSEHPQNLTTETGGPETLPQHARSAPMHTTTSIVTRCHAFAIASALTVTSPPN